MASQQLYQTRSRRGVSYSWCYLASIHPINFCVSVFAFQANASGRGATLIAPDGTKVNKGFINMHQSQQLQRADANAC